MKNDLVKYFRNSIAVVALLIAAAAQNSVQAQLEPGKSAQSADRIVGAWETTVQPRNCDTGEAIGNPFPGVLTFNQGGTLAEFGANPTTPFRTPGHGIWTYNAVTRDYTMKFTFLPLTPAGVAVGRLRVTQSVQLGRFSDEFTSSGGFVLTNFNGNVIGTGCSTSTAVRLNP